MTILLIDLEIFHCLAVTILSLMSSFQVYTVNQESRYVLVLNVPALGVTKELMELSSLYGSIEE